MSALDVAGASGSGIEFRVFGSVSPARSNNFKGSGFRVSYFPSDCFKGSFKIIGFNKPALNLAKDDEASQTLTA